MNFSTKNLGVDVSAGVVVFLVALPLCLGIAMASGAPVVTGILSGIVAGTVVCLLSGSEVSVSGPAAGLTVIVASGIATCGGYQYFLAAVVLAGIMQILFGLLRTGVIASLIPNSVITGMLTGIGLIIILKQIPHGLGRDTDFEGDESFFQWIDHETSFSEIFAALGSFAPGVVILSICSLLILMNWERLAKSVKFFKFFPGPLAVVLTGILLNELYRAYFPGLYISQEAGHLVSLPSGSGGSFFSALSFPAWDASKLPAIFTTAVAIALIASIETLLSLEAGDKIDPYRRTSNPNRELIAQGVGNTVCGLIGGLPITAVIVRTSANVYAGAKSRLSTLIHGILLFATIIMIPSLINKIPLASLAAILIIVGFKLAHPKLFVRMYRMGVDQFFPFILTVGVTVFSDLLTGVFVGLVVSMVFVVKGNYHSAITVVNEGEDFFLRFAKDVSFANKAKLKKELARIPAGSHLLIDGTSAMFIDKDILELLEDFKQNARHRNIRVEERGLNSKTHRLFGTA